MKKFEKNIDDRKVLVARLSELTGVNAHYTFVPRCAYEVGAFTVEKDGRLTVMEGADESILEKLIAENLIGECIEETHPVSATAAQPTADPAQIAQTDLGTEKWGEDDWEEVDASEETHEEEQEMWRPETDIFAESEEAETAEEGTAEDSEATQTEEADTVSDAEYEQEAEEESAASLGIRDAEETETFPLDAQISFPLEKHTAASLINLICMIHPHRGLHERQGGRTDRKGRFHHHQGEERLGKAEIGCRLDLSGECLM